MSQPLEQLEIRVKHQQRPQWRHRGLCQDWHLGSGPQPLGQFKRDCGAGGQPFIGFLTQPPFWASFPLPSSPSSLCLYPPLLVILPLMMNWKYNSKIKAKYTFLQTCTVFSIMKYFIILCILPVLAMTLKDQNGAVLVPHQSGRGPDKPNISRMLFVIMIKWHCITPSKVSLGLEGMN